MGSIYRKCINRRNYAMMTEVKKLAVFEGNIKCKGHKGEFGVLSTLNVLIWVVTIWIWR